MADQVRVAIVGCGLIGTQWDAERPAAAYALTHAAGFTRQDGAALVAVCDQDGAKAAAAAKRWGAAHSFTDPAALFAQVPVDVAVVAASSAARMAVVEPALAAGVKVLVIEKPLATTLEESRRLVAAIEAAGARTVVNYSRHWDPSMAALRARILGGELGTVQRFVGLYGKGISNNGSHMIDLVAFLCDARPRRARALGSPLAETEASWSQGRDRAWDAQVDYVDAQGRSFQLTLLATDQNAFTCFELRVIGSAGTAQFTHGGRQISYTGLEPDPNFAGYVVPGPAQPQPARALEAMERMAREAVALARGELTMASCDARTALRTAETVEAIVRSAHEDGRWIDIAAMDSN